MLTVPYCLISAQCCPHHDCSGWNSQYAETLFNSNMHIDQPRPNCIVHEASQIVPTDTVNTEVPRCQEASKQTIVVNILSKTQPFDKNTRKNRLSTNCYLLMQVTKVKCSSIVAVISVQQQSVKNKSVSPPSFIQDWDWHCQNINSTELRLFWHFSSQQISPVYYDKAAYRQGILKWNQGWYFSD